MSRVLGIFGIGDAVSRLDGVRRQETRQSSSAAGVEPQLAPKLPGIFNPAAEYHPANPLNPANAYHPDSAFNPANRYDPGNPLNPANQYNPTNPFNPANQYHPDNPLNPANQYNPTVPFAPLDGRGKSKR